MKNNMIRPALWSTYPTDTRDAYLRQVCAVVGADYPERATGPADEVRAQPTPMEVLSSAQAQGQTLEDVRDALILAVACEHVRSTYGPALTATARQTNDYEQRLQAMMPKVRTKAKATYKAMSEALAALPADPFDREAVFATDSTAAYRTLTDGIETLNTLVGTQGQIKTTNGRGLICRYVKVNPEAEMHGDDLKALSDVNRLVHHEEYEQVLAKAIRGDYGKTITGDLPTKAEAGAGVALLNQAQVIAQRKYTLPTWN